VQDFIKSAATRYGGRPARCRMVFAPGGCAAYGGWPTPRAFLAPAECLGEACLDAIGAKNPQNLSDLASPLWPDTAHPLHETVKIDAFLPGCPPSGAVSWHFLTDLIAGREPASPRQSLRYD